MGISADDFLDGKDAPVSKADAFLDGEAPDHSGIVGKSLAATVRTPYSLPQTNTQMPPAWKRGLAAVPGLGPLAQVTNEPWKPEEQEMAKSGTDIMSGAPLGLRNKLSLLVDPSDTQTREVVNQHYGQDVGLARNKYGELEYTNPETGRRTLLKPRGETLQSMAPTVGGSMDVAGQTGGALVAGLPTAAATGNPLLAAGAGALGAGVGQAVADSGKTVISNYLYGGAGVKAPQEQLTDISKNAVKAVGTTAIGEVVGGIPAAGRFLGRGFLDLSYGKALDLQAMSKEAQAGLKDYYSLIGSQVGVKPSISELVPSDPMARIISEKAYKASEQLTAEEEKRINSNLDTLSYNYQNFTDAFKPSKSYEYGSAGYNIQQELEAKKAAALSQQQLNDAVLKADAKSQIAGLPTMSETERNAELTQMLNKLEEAGKAEKDKAYGDLKVALGYPEVAAYARNSDKWFGVNTPENNVTISVLGRGKIESMWQKGYDLNKSGVLNSGDKYWSAIPDAFYKDPKNPSKGLKWTQGEDKVAAGGEDADLLKEFGVPNESKPAPAKAFSVFELIDNVQDLRSGTRAAMAASKGQIPADEQASADVAEILEHEIRMNLTDRGDGRILDLWENAKQKNAQYQDNFRRGIINTVMKRTGGFEDPVYNSATAGLLMRAGKGQDQSGVAQFAGILKGAPEEQERVRNMIWSVYKDHYLPPNGIPDKRSWQKFQTQMEGPMKYFFTDAERAKFQGIDDMTSALAASTSKLKAFQAAWNASPEYGGIPKTSQGLSNAVFRNAVSPQVLDKMLTVVKKMQPELFKEWQADTARQFAIRTSDASGMPVDSLISKYLDQYGNRLTKVMGPQYVANLRTYQKTAQMVQGGTGIKLDPDRPQSVLQQVIRAKFAPPMSEEGRWYSALLNWRKRAAGRVVYNALKSPEGLDSFIRSAAANAATPLAGGVWAQLNGAALVQSLSGQSQGGGPSKTSSELQTK